MKIIRNTAAFNSQTGASVVTIGNFDGVHQGHQKMLGLAKKVAVQHGLPLVALSFEPHPAEYFSGESAPKRLMSMADKCIAFNQQQVDVACFVAFNNSLATTGARAFAQQYLARDLQAAHVIVGDDFKYGEKRQGDIHSLRKDGQQFGFKVQQQSTVQQQGERISSTLIRSLLSAADFAMVEQLLDRPYTLSGKVSKGDQRGRTWGFPTLNLIMRHDMAVQGVYAVKVHGLDKSKALNGVANIGVRPTVGGAKRLLEVHLFDYNSDAYGRRICVEFCKKIRDEIKFGSFDALKQQIMADCMQAKNILMVTN